jgi:hypothetical protein
MKIAAHSSSAGGWPPPVPQPPWGGLPKPRRMKTVKRAATLAGKKNSCDPEDGRRAQGAGGRPIGRGDTRPAMALQRPQQHDRRRYADLRPAIRSGNYQSLFGDPRGERLQSTSTETITSVTRIHRDASSLDPPERQSCSDACSDVSIRTRSSGCSSPVKRETHYQRRRR